MTPEKRLGVTVDRCQRCSGLWFDAEELDRWLGAPHASDAGPPEARIPPRGLGSRPCPRCVRALDTAGWTDLVLDRCSRCRGLFVEARELIQMQQQGLPTEVGTFESRFAEAMAAMGHNVITAAVLARLIIRLFLRV